MTAKTNRWNMFERKIRASFLKLVNSKDESCKLKELNEIIRKDKVDNEDNNKLNIYKKRYRRNTFNKYKRGR